MPLGEFPPLKPDREIVMDETRTLCVEGALPKQLTATNYHDGVWYYAHDDGLHRIIWIFLEPVTDLIGRNIKVILERNSYGGRRVALPDFIGRSHLVVRMMDVVAGQAPPVTAEEILSMSPRNKQLGRKPVVEDAVVVKANVPEEIADVFRELGNGNISEGIRVAGRIVMNIDPSRSPLPAIVMLVSACMF